MACKRFWCFTWSKSCCYRATSKTLWDLQDSERDDLTKLAIGCLLFGGAIAWLAGGQLVADATGKVPLVWALVYHFLSAIGYLYFAPVAIASRADAMSWLSLNTHIARHI